METIVRKRIRHILKYMVVRLLVWGEGMLLFLSFLHVIIFNISLVIIPASKPGV